MTIETINFLNKFGFFLIKFHKSYSLGLLISNFLKFLIRIKHRIGLREFEFLM